MDIPQSQYFDSLPDSHLARILYRDSLQQKHGNRTRLEEELGKCSAVKSRGTSHAEEAVAVSITYEPLSRIAVDFMEQVRRLRNCLYCTM